MFGNLMEEIKKPFNILMLVIALISLIIAFYSLSQRYQRPTYTIYNEVSKIFDSKNNSPKLILLDQNREQINKNVYLVTLAFWNSGKLPIEPQDVRRDINFSITNCEEIIDYSVIYQTNPDITNFSLLKSTDKKSLILKWKHLDPNNGAKFQVFYIGSSYPNCKFAGNILGNNKITNGQPWASRYFLGKLILLLIMVAMPMFTFFSIYLVNCSKTINKGIRLLLTFIFCVMYIWVLFSYDKLGGVKLPF